MKTKQTETTAKKSVKPSAFPPIIPGFPSGGAGLAGAAAVLQADQVMSHLGNPAPQHLRYAVEFRESLPGSIRHAARDARGACAMIYALLLSDEPALCHKQIQGLANRVDPVIHAQVVTLRPEVAAVANRARLPLVNLALPALRRLQPAEFQRFLVALNWLIESDGRIVLLEFVLQKIICRQIEPHFTGARPPAIQYYSIKPLVSDCELLLSALAYTGQAEPGEITRAFQTGVTHIRAAGASLSLRPRERCGLSEVNRALDRLAQAAPQIRKNMIEACVGAVGADGVVQENEAELLRAIAETLDCPMPPLVVADS